VSRPTDAASSRQRLAEAAELLASFRREAGVPPPGDALSGRRVAADASLRAALAAAEERVRTLEEELARTQREAAAAEEQNRLLTEAQARSEGEAEALEALRRRAAKADGRAAEAETRAAEAEARAVATKERATLLEAETVRLESLRRGAERAAADIEARGRAVEEALRGDLRNANAMIDRKAAEAGALEARMKAEADALRGRLETAVARLQGYEREKRLELARGKEEESVLQVELQRALAVAAALRQAAGSTRAISEEGELQLRRDLAAAESSLAEMRAAYKGKINDFARASAELKETRAKLEALEAEPAAAPPAAPGQEDFAAPVADDGLEEPLRPGFIAPPVDPVLDPGWARLLRLVRPPVEAAYAHLRRLSGTALTSGQKTLLKMAAASIAAASDSISSVELALEDSPAPAAASSVLPILESSLAAWEPSFRSRGVALSREWPAALPETAHDPKALRIVLHHILRNALEALPRGARLTVRGARGADGGLRLEFNDDGPGFPAAWLERRFEPFAAARRGRAGLGLSLVRRTLRRWGGEAEASNAPAGRGARLTLLFAPPPPPPSAPFK
jgi:signal transduction histidine kinase